jgi:LemA protein
MNTTDIIILLMVILFILLIIYIAIVNKLRKAVIKIEEASADIDVALVKRYDLITKMVEVVKGYTKYEKEVLLEVINLRKNMSVSEKVEANDKLSNGLDKINMVVENYPELKASENFKVLQKSILKAFSNFPFLLEPIKSVIIEPKITGIITYCISST